ncbi:MAG: OmpA family protein [Acetivibrionales bacterium]|jgi:chemotaxis protein MotB
MKRRRNFKTVREPFNFWPSFADVMSTIALVLFFLMLLAYIQNIITGKNLEFVRKELSDKQKKLDAYQIQISEAEGELRLLQQEVEETQAEVERGKRELKLSQKEIENQKKIIAESNQELGNLRTKLQNIAVLRVDILKKVKESIEKEIGRKNEQGEELVTIGENANIVINESVVFDFGSSTIKYSGKKLLDQFAIAFEKILDDTSVRNNIDTISIDGHADEVGSADDNMKLSSERATNVLNYLMQSNPDLESKYGKYFAASGYSEFRPIDPGTSEQARQKNRRIEISINIKDSNVQNIIEEYLSGTDKILNAD